jgi:hypothetical protein
VEFANTPSKIESRGSLGLGTGRKVARLSRGGAPRDQLSAGLGVSLYNLSKSIAVLRRAISNIGT